MAKVVLFDAIVEVQWRDTASSASMPSITYLTPYDASMEQELLRQHEAALVGCLANDDMDGWHAVCDTIKKRLPAGDAAALIVVQREWTQLLVRWFEDNAVRAVERTQVLHAWTQTVPRIHYDRTLHTLLARGLEGIANNEKIDLLQGRGQGKAQELLHAFLLRGNDRGIDRGHWTLVSPAWVGAPGTPLRQAALDAGWNVGMFPAQMHRQLKALSETPQNTPPAWTSWMALPHCAVVLYELHHMKSTVEEGINHFACVPTMPWADPRDVALAQAIADHGPATFHCAVGDGSPAACSAQEHERLRELVKVHNVLGLWDDLENAVLQGTIEGLFVGMQQDLALPELAEGCAP